MRVITCASYYGTGSSAVTDLFGECDNVCSLGDYEYRFLQDPDGISDLEYNVVENNHRHNTSDAIKRFIRFIRDCKRMGYGGYDIFGDEFERATRDYVAAITELKAHSWWNKDRVDKGSAFIAVDRLYSLARRVLTGSLRSEKRFTLLNGREYGYYTAIDEAAFLEHTRTYVERLLSKVNRDGMPFVMVDQMVPPTNVGRYTRYFNDVRVVVVERDPRDIYLLEKKDWQWGVIPVKNVHEYVQWYRITRKYSHPADEDREQVLRIRFEDMIYRYEATRRALFDFVGMDESCHARPRTRFDPARSIRNTNLKARCPDLSKDVAVIEHELKEYLYDYPTA